MAEELETVEELEKYAFSLIQSMPIAEDDKYAVKARMGDVIHDSEDAVYEKHGAITSYGIY